MQPPASLPALPFVVAADRAGAVRRRRIALPIVFLAAAVAGGTWPFMFDAFLDGRQGLGWSLALLEALGLVALVVGIRYSRRPPEDDWLFALEPAGLRCPPGRRAATRMPGHPGMLVPWPLVTTVTPKRENGSRTLHIRVRPEMEAVALGQGISPERARLFARKRLRLRLDHGTLPPAECLRLITATRDAYAD